MGLYTRGRRNNNGQRLVEFCENNNFIIANSLFKHRACHTTTQESTRELTQEDGSNKTVRIFNQIDYLLVRQHTRHTLRNARSYAGTLTESDHRLVVMTMTVTQQISTSNKKRIQANQPKLDIQRLVADDKVKAAYQQAFISTNTPAIDTTPPQNVLDTLQKHLHLSKVHRRHR